MMDGAVAGEKESEALASAKFLAICKVQRSKTKSDVQSIFQY